MTDDADTIASEYLAMVYAELTDRATVDKARKAVGQEPFTDEQWESHIAFTRAIFGVPSA